MDRYRMKTDDGTAPVLAVALLIGLAVIAGTIISVIMFAALDDVSGVPPDVRFRASADSQCLYHAGGDVLYMHDLIFYDTAKSDKSLADISGSVKKNGTNENIWKTGEQLRLPVGTSLDCLSIVGLDSKNRPVLLYMGAMVHPRGDMVPDTWPKPTATVTPTTTPTPMPTGPPLNPGESDDGRNMFHEFTFGGIKIIEGKGDTFDTLYPEYYQYNGTLHEYAFTIPLTTNADNSEFSTKRIEVAFYNQTGEMIGTKRGYTIGNGKRTLAVSVPAGIKPGDWCYITIIGTPKGGGGDKKITIIIRMGTPPP